MTEHGIAVHALSRSFQGRRVLSELQLHVASGESVAIVGPNGSGKTTLLEILATVLMPSAGRAAIHGFDVVSRAEQVRRIVGYAPSSLQSFYPRLSGAQNLAFFAALHGLTGARARRAVRSLLERFELAGAADRRFERYSDGMKARLVLARALLNDPAVLLLDEPTKSLDPAFRPAARELLVQRPGGPRTTLWVTHDPAESLMADRLVVLDQGRFRPWTTADAMRGAEAWAS